MKTTTHHSNMLEMAHVVIKRLITGTSPTIVQSITLQPRWREKNITLPLEIITLVKTTTRDIGENTPLLLLGVENHRHQNEAMITAMDHHLDIVLLPMSESAITTRDLLLPVWRGCTSHLPMRRTTHLLHSTEVAHHHHHWVRGMNIKQEREKVGSGKVPADFYY